MAQDSTTRMDPNASCDAGSTSTPLLHSGAQQQLPLDLDSWKEKLDTYPQEDLRAFLAKLAMSDETVASRLMELIKEKEKEEKAKHEQPSDPNSWKKKLDTYPQKVLRAFKPQPHNASSKKIPIRVHENELTSCLAEKAMSDETVASRLMELLKENDKEEKAKRERQQILDTWKEIVKDLTENELIACKDVIESALSNIRQQPDGNPSTSTDREPQPYNQHGTGKQKIRGTQKQ